MISLRRLREQVVAPAMVLGGLLLVPWILYLGGALPHTTRARNWSLMWTGVDVAEAVGLVLTGILIWRRSPYRALSAVFTSALLAADAWIDVTTSAPGHARALAITMAVLAEVPAAIGCLVLSIRAFPASIRVAEPGRYPTPTPTRRTPRPTVPQPFPRPTVTRRTPEPTVTRQACTPTPAWPVPNGAAPFPGRRFTQRRRLASTASRWATGPFSATTRARW